MFSTGSQLRDGGNNLAKNNLVVESSANSTLRSNVGVEGTTLTKTTGSGLIITKGTVL